MLIEIPLNTQSSPYTHNYHAETQWFFSFSIVQNSKAINHSSALIWYINKMAPIYVTGPHVHLHVSDNMYPIISCEYILIAKAHLSCTGLAYKSKPYNLGMCFLVLVTKIHDHGNFGVAAFTGRASDSNLYQQNLGLNAK